MSSEAKVQSVCMNYLYNTYRAVRISTPTKVGDPDAVFCLYGLYVELEFKKTGGGKHAKMQKRAAKKCRRAGGHYILVDSFLGMLEKINEIIMKNEIG